MSRGICTRSTPGRIGFQTLKPLSSFRRVHLHGWRTAFAQLCHCCHAIRKYMTIHDVDMTLRRTNNHHWHATLRLELPNSSLGSNGCCVNWKMLKGSQLNSQFAREVLKIKQNVQPFIDAATTNYSLQFLDHFRYFTVYVI